MPIVDLFCGCGGLSTGFQNLFDIVAAYDKWDVAVNTYNHFLAHENAHGIDLVNVDEAVENITEMHPDIIIGSPPCQDFSYAGHREEGERANLTYTFAEIVTRIAPLYFVMENVPGAKDSETYKRAKQLYIDNHYGLTEVILDASKCGVPQHRSRFFCIGAINQPNDFILGNLLSIYIEREKTVSEYFNEHHYNLNFYTYYRHPRTYGRRAIFTVDEVSPTIRGVNRPKPDTYILHKNDRINEDELQNVHILSITERALIQTFPEHYDFEHLPYSRHDIDQMIGNAVPVALARYVALCLNNFINHQQGREETAFCKWLRDKKYTDRNIGDLYANLQNATNYDEGNDISNLNINRVSKNIDFQNLDEKKRKNILHAIRLRNNYLENVRRIQ
jgi:DNA-methyltransferase (dcm)